MQDQYYYAFAIGQLPDPLLHPIRARKTADFFKTLPGFIGLHIVSDPRRNATLLVFDTLNNAKIARNRIGATGNSTAKHIMRAKLENDGQTITILDVAD